ncbi:MAG: hypothetical protein OXB88_01640 [Bacteriovoracales bacterium]|nr:hypothetical protein [Bacteriovoracales bacterium]
MDNDKWKEKFSDFINICQGELKKTTKIGQKMLSASKTNTELHKTFEDLGKYTRDQILQEKLSWNDDKVKNLLRKIETYERNLEEFEKEVKDIKSQEYQK